MSRQFLRSCCTAFFAFACVTSVSAATVFVGAKRVGTFPNQFFVWSPTNVVINVGDTVMWTNLTMTHSVNPAASSTDPFCGGGTNLVNSCTVTFQNGGFYPYDCFQHLPQMTGTVTVLGPSVLITNPPNKTLLGTPGAVQLRAAVSHSNGSITNVQFLNNGAPFATNTSAPFAATLSNAAPGNYVFRARAADSAGLIATSPVVNVRIIDPPALVLTNSGSNPLRFFYNTLTGISYVVEGSTALTNFSPIVTNSGTGGALQFTQTNPAPAQRFFRVRLQ